MDCHWFCFFFQAEDGIRDLIVTGVQTCALPISPRRPEIAPYVVTKNVSVAAGGGFDRSQKVTGGADLKYGLTPNLTLDAKIGRASGRGRGEISGVAVSLKKKKHREDRLTE